MKRFLILFLSLLLALPGCAAQQEPPAAADNEGAAEAAPAEPASSPIAVPVAPVSPSAAPVVQVSASTEAAPPIVADPAAPETAVDFSVKLFQQAVLNGEVNPVISPSSAYLCLAMVMNGAQDITLSEFEKVFGGNLDEINAYSGDFISKLSDTKGETVLRIADSVWADDDKVSVDERFVRALTDYYGAETFSADLPSTEAREAINAWVKEKTNGLIPTLHEENYPQETVLVLLNTLYLKARWKNEFMAWSTYDTEFNKADGTIVTVPFMNANSVRREYIKTGNAEGILLPYDDEKTAFLALRPTDGSTVKEFAASLSAASFANYANAAEVAMMNFSMPKFTLSYSADMNDMLENMGLKTMFDPAQARLGGMGTGKGASLYVSQVLQKVKIEVDEKGTEAAAVTEAAMALNCMPPDDMVELHLDSPFVYAVMDMESGMPLFIGVLDDPSVQK